MLRKRANAAPTETLAIPAIRDRVVDFRRVPASELLPNPKNWRIHHDAQRAAFRSVVVPDGTSGM